MQFPFSYAIITAMILPLVQRYIYTYIKQKLSESIFFVQKYHLPW
mgnify:CR=1 FL=1